MIVSKCPCVAPHHQSEQVDTIFLFNAHGCHIYTEDEFHKVRHLVDNSSFAANLDQCQYGDVTEMTSLGHRDQGDDLTLRKIAI